MANSNGTDGTLVGAGTIDWSKVIELRSVSGEINRFTKTNYTRPPDYANFNIKLQNCNGN